MIILNGLMEEELGMWDIWNIEYRMKNEEYYEICCEKKEFDCQ